MARGSEVKVGPWPMGLNLLDKHEQIEDNQLRECLNFDIDNTGILVPRRGVVSVALKRAGTHYLLGSITLKDETTPRAAVGSFDGTNTTFDFYRNPRDIADTLVGATVPSRYSRVVSYLDKLWYIPTLATGLGKSTSATAATLATTTDVAAMPYGDEAIILKDRLFIIREATSEIYFSKVSDFTVWSAPDGGVIKVNPGDNQPITKVVSLNNQLVIFKRDQTYILTYTNNPTGDGTLRQVSSDQGAIDAITFNNEVYTFNARSVFKFVNGYFSDIGIQLDFINRDNLDATSAVDASLVVIGKTLIMGKTPAGNIYAMNLDTGAWTMYKFEGTTTFASAINSRDANGVLTYFGNGTNALTYMVTSRNPNRTTDSFTFGVTKCPEYSMRTKSYVFDDKESWKRLYSWNIDARYIATGASTAKVFINDLLAFQTNDIQDLIGGGTQKSARFRSISMALSSVTRNAASPVEAVGLDVYMIKAVIGAQSGVVK